MEQQLELLSERVNENNAIALAQKLIAFRIDKTFSDICLISKCDDKRFNCHRNVLAAASDYFSAMFLSGLNESKNSEIYLDIPSHVLDLMICHLYAENITITDECVNDLLKHSHECLISGLVDKCEKFLIDSINATNFLEFGEMAKLYELPALLKKMSLYYDLHFVEIVQKDAFTKMPLNEFKRWLERDSLCVDSEETVFIAIEKWMNKEPNVRSEHCTELLGLIKFPLLSQSSILRLTRSFVSKIDIQFKSEAYDYIFDALNWRLDETFPFPGKVNSNPRQNVNCASVFIIKDNIYIFRYNQWKQISIPPNGRSIFAVTGTQFFYYHNRNVYILDLVKETSISFPVPNSNQVSQIMVGPYLYIFGRNSDHYNYGNRLLWKIDIETNAVIHTEEILNQDKRYGVFFEDVLYLLVENVVPFRVNAQIKCLSIDFYKDLQQCIAHKQKLYAFCAARALQMYSFETQCWTRLNQLPIGILLGVQTLAGKILIAFDDGKTFMYNDDNDSWHSFLSIEL